MTGNARRTLAGGLLLAVLLAVMAQPVMAQELRLSTPYPSVVVDAGDRITLALLVTADEAMPVSLDVTGAPDGWETSLRGGGFLVGGVFTDPEEPAEAELEVSVPAEVAEGTYQVTVEASGGGETDSLQIQLRVDQEATGETTLTSDFPNLRGSADTTFRFNAALENTHPQERTYALAAAGAQGWQVAVRPSAEDASTVTLDPGETANLNVEAVPPPNVTAGTYPLRVQVTGGGETITLDLEAEITGTFDIELRTADERLNIDANPGQPTSFEVVVVNTGTSPLQEVSLSASPPRGWQVSFDPDEIAVIEPGDSTQVQVEVTPADDAIIGDYRSTIRATAPEVQDEFDVRVTIETSRAWGVLGIGLVIAAIAGLGWVFRTFGRR